MNIALASRTTKPSATLQPLPEELYRGLIAVAAVGIFSFFVSTGLFLFIAYRIINWKRRRPDQPLNQFVILIFNLLLADIQQSVGFGLNARWVIQNGILVGTSTCWAQAWSVQTGNMASGIWCSAIGVHTFASVLFNYRLKPATFYFIVVFLWTFVYACAIIGLALHPSGLYVRAGGWCWVDAKFMAIRLWLHYFWIFVAEFGTVAVYGGLYIGLITRLRTNYYTPTEAKHAKQAAWLMALYPAAYVTCTLPLASARMMSLAGKPPSFRRLCVAGAMVTSNGWIDVLVYSLTRRISLLGHDPPSEDCGIETFTVPWHGGLPESRFGNVTTIEAVRTENELHQRNNSIFKIRHSVQKGDNSRGVSQQSMSGSMDRLVWQEAPKSGVRAETTVEVQSELLELDDIRAMSHQRSAERRALQHRTSSRTSKEKEDFEFDTTPPGYGS